MASTMGDMRSNARDTPISVGILDNDVLALEALRVVVSRLHPPGISTCTVVWQTTSVALALHRCASGEGAPDVLLLDMALGGISGGEVAARIRKRNARTAIIGITAYNPADYLADAADSGMQALLAKDALMRELAPAMAAIVQGGVWPVRSANGGAAVAAIFATVEESHRRLAETPGAGGDMDSLSSREREILRRFAEGEDADGIAASLGISRNSVFTYTRRACAKLGVGTRAEAVRRIRSPWLAR
ncbi:response regulator transcription factor [Bifidobacterium eulemuris]|uniref:DNA-binding response regulator n=1 Tax=Bifidobacterium eulemuris TaxID=1765219 RepID=A0A261G5L0_9BIFI|nr:response regulator transcription factor [Bifidobacterium eulemuris]OZG66493.1 DNA-binding response regulator [Bifidobacterium eulemuris]QOL32589.1 response regulator transcription factor [Bifidobacterium eulemuris]